MNGSTVWHTAARRMAPVAQAACMGMAATLLAQTTARATPPTHAATTPTAAAADISTLCGPTAQSQPLDQLLQHISICQNQPDWLTHLGQRLLDQGRYPEAADHLERALLLAPQHAGAALAYSIALAGLGDLPSALQLLTQLTRRPDLHATDRQALLAAQVRMAETPLPQLVGNSPIGWVQRQSAGLRVGYDNNLLGAPRLSNLTLTLPGGDATLPLDAAGQPRPGNYQRADLRLEATHTQASGRRTDVALGLQHRSSPALPSTDTTQLEWVLDTQPATQTSGAWANLGQSSLHTQGGTRYHTSGAAAGWAWAGTGTCQPRLGLEWQNRRLASNPMLSGSYRGAVASWGCQLAKPAASRSAWLPGSWHLSARLGADHPYQATRPGGTQHTSALRATLRWPLWVAEAELQHTQDTVGYSPLLANNRVRHTTRGLMRVERFVPLQHISPGLYATVGLELYSQHSNLALFKINSASVYAAVRKPW